MEGNDITRREFIKQVASVTVARPTEGFLLNQIKFNANDTPEYQKTIDTYFEMCEEEAMNDPDGNRGNTKASIKRLRLQIELYKRGVAKCTKEDIIASLEDDYYAAEYQETNQDLLKIISNMIKEISLL